jgi:hypothetical protein
MTDPELVTNLLRAARAWRKGLIPSTSTGMAGPTAALVRAIEAIDHCDHPRDQRVFVPGRTEGIPPGELCGKCGAALHA